MSVAASYEPTLSSTNTSDLNLGSLASDPSIVKTIPTGVNAFNASTTPPVTKDFVKDITLSAGAFTLDLTALDQGDLVNDNWTGLKVQLYKFVTDPTNTSAVTINANVANTYEIISLVGGELDMSAGDEVTIKRLDTLVDVGPTAKIIELTSPQSDAKIQVHLVAG